MTTRSIYSLRALFLFLACLSVLLFGVWNVGRPANPTPQFDIWWLYTSGKCWLDGCNPYDFDQLVPYVTPLNWPERAALGYPPQAAPLFMAVALIPIEMVTTVTLIFCLLSLVLLAFTSWHIYLKPLQEKPGLAGQLLPWLLLAIVIGNPFSTHAIFLGQSTLFFGALAILAWYLIEIKNSEILGGILLGIPTIKPQFSFLPFLWIIFQLRLKAVIATVITIGLLSLWPIYLVGPIDMLLNWWHGLQEFQLDPNNTSVSPGVFHFQAALRSLGFWTPSLWPIAILIFLILWFYRAHFPSLVVLSLLMGASILFIFGQNPDLTILLPALMGPLFYYGCRSYGSYVAAFVLLFLLFIPQRIFGRMEMPSLLHYREWVLLALYLWLSISAFNKK